MLPARSPPRRSSAASVTWACRWRRFRACCPLPTCAPATSGSLPISAAWRKNSAERSGPSPRCAPCWHRPRPATCPPASSCAACPPSPRPRSSVVSAGESAAWLQGALGELHATLTAKDVPAGGPAGGIYADEVFTRHRGQVTIFVPCARPIPPTGRVAPTQIPAAELAVIEHSGPPADVDRAYGTLATYVARHTLA